jgi:hypothetical protein
VRPCSWRDESTRCGQARATRHAPRGALREVGGGAFSTAHSQLDSQNAVPRSTSAHEVPPARRTHTQAERPATPPDVREAGRRHW